MNTNATWTDNFRSGIELFAGIGLIASVTYAFGLIFVTAQIVYLYEISFMDAWYASSLMPKEIILGQMFKVSALGWGIFFMWLCFMLRYGPKVIGLVNLFKSPIKYQWLFLFGFTVTFTILISLIRVGLNYLDGQENVLKNVSIDVIKVPIVLIMYVVTACAYYYERQYAWPRLVTIFLISILVYVCAFINSAFQGGFNHLPIPKVAITLDTNRVINGRLLGHSSGYWHILNQQSQIVSISDSLSPIVVVNRSTSVLFPDAKIATEARKKN